MQEQSLSKEDGNVMIYMLYWLALRVGDDKLPLTSLTLTLIKGSVWWRHNTYKTKERDFGMLLEYEVEHAGVREARCNGAQSSDQGKAVERTETFLNESCTIKCQVYRWWELPAPSPSPSPSPDPRVQQQVEVWRGQTKLINTSTTNTKTQHFQLAMEVISRRQDGFRITVFPWLLCSVSTSTTAAAAAAAATSILSVASTPKIR